MQNYLKFVPIISILIIYAVRMKEVLTKRNTIKGEIKEKATFQLFMACGIITALGGIGEFIWKGYQWHGGLVILGWILGISSFWIRWSTIAALGRFWSLHNELRDGHQFIQSGPFKWMRHPTYFSMILELLSGVLILSAPITAFIVFIIFIPTLILRIKNEENLLVEKFGEAYRKYRQTTFAIIPMPPKSSW